MDSFEQLKKLILSEKKKYKNSNMDEYESGIKAGLDKSISFINKLSNGNDSHKIELYGTKEGKLFILTYDLFKIDHVRKLIFRVANSKKNKTLLRIKMGCLQ